MVWGKTVAIDAQEPASGSQAPAPMSIHAAAGTKDFARTARNSFGYLAVAVGSVRWLRADADFDQVITPITCAVADLDLRSRIPPRRTRTEPLTDPMSHFRVDRFRDCWSQYAPCLFVTKRHDRIDA
jgi:hypothetical protein